MKGKGKGKVNKKVLVIVSIVILLLLLASPFYIQLKHIHDLMTQIEKENNLKLQNRDTITALNDLKTDLENGKNKVQLYDQLMPTYSDNGALIDFFRETAQGLNLQFSSIVFDAEIPKEGYTEVPIILTISGNYNELVALIENISKARRLVRIDSISMNTSGVNTNGVSMEITARAFYMFGQK